MKKVLRNLVIALAIVPMCVMLTACGGGDNKKNTGGGFRSLDDYNNMAKAVINAGGGTLPSLVGLELGASRVGYDLTGAINFRFDHAYEYENSSGETVTGTMSWIFAGKSMHVIGSGIEQYYLYNNETGEYDMYTYDDGEGWNTMDDELSFYAANILYVVSSPSLYNVAQTTDEFIKYTPKNVDAYQTALAGAFGNGAGFYVASTVSVTIDKTGKFVWYVQCDENGDGTPEGFTKSTVTLGGQSITVPQGILDIA